MDTKCLVPPTNEYLSAPDTTDVRLGPRTAATRDHDRIRQWAMQHRAEPATGESTSSGEATLDVNDGGAGIRFNFPAAGRFRPIAWEEWFENFDRHRLIFLYEEDYPAAVAVRAYELWSARGGQPGRDREDWFEAERQLGKATASQAAASYRLVKGGFAITRAAPR